MSYSPEFRGDTIPSLESLVIKSSGTITLESAASILFPMDGTGILNAYKGILSDIGSLSFAGSTSGTLTFDVPSTITTYSVMWPSAQSSGTQFLGNDGAGNLSWSTPASGANTSLSNLSGPTSINQTLIPSTSNTFNVGSSSAFWNNLFVNAINFPTNGTGVIGRVNSIGMLGSASGSIFITVPSTIATYSLTMPDAQATGTQFLQNDGSGNLSWASVAVNAINQLTGDVTAGPAVGSESVAATIASIQGTTVSGTTGTGNVVFSVSPTITGLLTAAQITTTAFQLTTSPVAGDVLTSDSSGNGTWQALPNPGLDQEAASNGGGFYTMTKAAGLNLAINIGTPYTDNNFTVRLPDATTLQIGSVVQIATWASSLGQNFQPTNINVANNDGTGFGGRGTIPVYWNQTLALSCADNSSTNGTWQILSLGPSSDISGDTFIPNNLRVSGVSTLLQYASITNAQTNGMPSSPTAITTGDPNTIGLTISGTNSSGGSSFGPAAPTAMNNFVGTSSYAAGTFTGASNASAWTEAGFTTQSFTGNGYIEYTVTSTSASCGLGLCTTNTGAAPTYMIPTYALLTDGAGNLYHNESGSLTRISGYSVNDVLQTARVGTTIVYSRNGTTIATITGVSSTAPLYGIAYVDGSSGGPYTINDIVLQYNTSSGSPQTSSLLEFMDGSNNLLTYVDAAGDLIFNAVGNGLEIKTGSNARAGTATLVGGTVTVGNTSVTANTLIFYSVQTPGGTQGFLSATSVASTSFTIASTSSLDTSTVAWMLVEGN